jgi:hypothetical protein
MVVSIYASLGNHLPGAPMEVDGFFLNDLASTKVRPLEHAPNVVSLLVLPPFSNIPRIPVL